jgi:hypothetical protein
MIRPTGNQPAATLVWGGLRRCGRLSPRRARHRGPRDRRLAGCPRAGPAGCWQGPDETPRSRTPPARSSWRPALGGAAGVPAGRSFAPWATPTGKHAATHNKNRPRRRNRTPREEAHGAGWAALERWRGAAAGTSSIGVLRGGGGGPSIHRSAVGGLQRRAGEPVPGPRAAAPRRAAHYLEQARRGTPGSEGAARGGSGERGPQHRGSTDRRPARQPAPPHSAVPGPSPDHREKTPRARPRPRAARPARGPGAGDSAAASSFPGADDGTGLPARKVVHPGGGRQARSRSLFSRTHLPPSATAPAPAPSWRDCAAALRREPGARARGGGAQPAKARHLHCP